MLSFRIRSLRIIFHLKMDIYLITTTTVFIFVITLPGKLRATPKEPVNFHCGWPEMSICPDKVQQRILWKFNTFYLAKRWNLLAETACNSVISILLKKPLLLR